MNEIAELRNGRCHCGAVRFTVRLNGGLTAARRCTCSYCRMRGAVTLSARLADFTVTEGEALLARYRFNTSAAEHFFCSRCGIYTHHLRRSNPQEYGVNAACLEGLSPFDFPVLPVMDGINHPKDIGGPSRRAGKLHYVPATES